MSDHKLFTVYDFITQDEDSLDEDDQENKEEVEPEEFDEDDEDDEDGQYEEPAEDEFPVTDYNNGSYKVGYYKIKLNTNTNSELFDTISESFYDDEEDLMSDAEESEESYNHEQIFEEVESINNCLDNMLESFDGTDNPFTVIAAISDVLDHNGLLLPDFNLDPSVDEWIFDIELEDIHDDRKCYLHLEILKEDETSYFVRAGVVPI